MKRLRRFFRDQRAAFRSLLGLPRISLANIDLSTAFVHHAPPADNCACPGHNGHPNLYGDHLDGCAWYAARCSSCEGWGHCLRCGGDGEEPATESEATP